MMSSAWASLQIHNQFEPRRKFKTEVRVGMTLLEGDQLEWRRDAKARTGPRHWPNDWPDDQRLRKCRCFRPTSTKRKKAMNKILKTTAKTSIFLAPPWNCTIR